MAKAELKGIVLAVSTVEVVGDKNTEKQSLFLKVPAFRDEFGQSFGSDEEWNLEAVGKQVGQLNLHAGMVGQKAKCTVYINSRRFEKDGKVMHFIGAKLGAIELLGAAVTETAQMPVESTTGLSANPDEDDLPF